MNHTKKHKLTLDALETLIHEAERVDSKFGHYEDGTPCDWSEWVDLRRALQNARHAIAREGRKAPTRSPASTATQGLKIEDYP